MPTSDPDQLFPGERDRLWHIRDCERVIRESQAKTDAFNRKAKACILAHHFGLPPRLYRAMEVVLYDSSPSRRKTAASLIMEWARHG